MTAYFSVSILCLVITNVYALFGHGVRSESMDFMFLYPLIGGTGVFLLMTLIAVYLPERLREVSRVGYNLHNSGIASLTSAAMLTGIMEIAGTSSKWIGYIKLAGYVLVCGAFVCQSLRFLKRAVR
jgi:hypothetical protein